MSPDSSANSQQLDEMLARLAEQEIVERHRIKNLDLELARANRRLRDILRKRAEIEETLRHEPSERGVADTGLSPLEETPFGAGLDLNQGQAVSPTVEDQNYKGSRARLGTKHFLIFQALSDLGPLPPGDISSLTGISLKRIRDQMKVDIIRGTIKISDDAEVFGLTKKGRDLLSRFIEYRRANGISLPNGSNVIK